MKNTALLNSTFEATLTEVSQYLEAVGYQKNTKRAIERMIIHFLEWLELQHIKNLKVVHSSQIKTYQKYLSNRPNKLFAGCLSSRTIYAYLWAVRLLFVQQEQSGTLSKNPMSGYVFPKVECQTREVLSQAEIKQLYEHCESLEERIVLHLYYGLGLRRSEGVALNIKEIDVKNNLLYVLKGKGGKSRNMPLTASIQADLKDYLLKERAIVKHNALMLDRTKKRMSGYSALVVVKRLLKRANIDKKIGLHSLRHSIATHLIENGMPLEQVRNYLGHARLETTQKYVHYDASRVFKSKI
jgi:integrase/recombinase XerD